jgi:hypothetical protein
MTVEIVKALRKKVAKAEAKVQRLRAQYEQVRQWEILAAELEHCVSWKGWYTIDGEQEPEGVFPFQYYEVVYGIVVEKGNQRRRVAHLIEVKDKQVERMEDLPNWLEDLSTQVETERGKMRVVRAGAEKISR